MRTVNRPASLLVTLAAGAALAAGGIGPASAVTRAHSARNAFADHVIGTGTLASCTSAAVVRAVAVGGDIKFRCGPRPVTITMTATAKVVNTSHWVILDGGSMVTLSGAGTRRILYMDTCDKRQIHTAPDCYDQQWPHLVVQNITLADGYSGARENPRLNFGGASGGGAIYAEGGQLTVVNSRFVDNRCYAVGPDLGGGAIRALAQWNDLPVYIVHDSFLGGSCSNGGALSSIGVSWVVSNSVMIGNKAIGYGQNPALPGTPGGGSGGAIYADGNRYSLTIKATIIRDNTAREGGGAVFFVSDNRTGRLAISNSTLLDNPSGVFWTRAYPGIYYHSSGRPTIYNSPIS